MMKKGVFKSKAVTAAVLGAFVLLVTPVGVFAQDQINPQLKGSIIGFVYGEDGKTPVQGAVVKVRNMGNQTEFVSDPSDANGMYKISGIEAGWYFLSVMTDLGEFTLGTGFYLKGSEVAKMLLSLKRGGTIEASGSAYATKKPFFKTGGGIAVLVAGAAGAGFGIYQLTKSEEEASPVSIR
jgi:hypothetical protein